MRRVTIGVDPPYDVVVGAGVLAHVGDILGDRRCVAVVSQPAIAQHYVALVVDALRAAGAEVLLSTMADGEAAKSLATVERLCSEWAAGGLRDRRHDRGEPPGGEEPRWCVPPAGRGARRHRHPRDAAPARVPRRAR